MEQTNPPELPSFPLYEEPGTALATHSAELLSQKSKSPATSLTTTSQYSSAALGLLQTRLQTLGLGAPIWNIVVEPGTEHKAQRFIGTLSIGENLPEKITVSIVEPGTDPAGAGLPSKKDARAVLAQKALKMLESVPVLPKGAEASAPAGKVKQGTEDGINWIGQYNNSVPMECRVLTYTESSTPLANNPGPTFFSCTLDIAIPTSSLGPELQSFALYTTCTFPPSGTPPVFSTKKAAKYHCSRLAGLELVNLGLLLKDGTLPPKSTTISPQPQARTDEISIASSIPARCDKLGLPPPRYEFVCSSGDSSSVNAFVDCSAHFPPIHGLPDPVAVVKGVFGKKRAKEECARVLMRVLDRVERWRLKGSGLWEENE